MFLSVPSSRFGAIFDIVNLKDGHREFYCFAKGGVLPDEPDTHNALVCFAVRTILGAHAAIAITNPLPPVSAVPLDMG
jgi:hypothetical protein